MIVFLYTYIYICITLFLSLNLVIDDNELLGEGCLVNVKTSQDAGSFENKGDGSSKWPNA